ncbi:hypothetical protein [Haloferula rosea]|uniref:Uncharacterized protein n=1 Tax=Haloferula rosea TaxID=490093 RepID=A0A934VBL3_9BACT|nr:hypothetical protein [Haloferula rosea]MBK1827508.1 hypothetical protein [Haloferula rosea]
MRASRRYTTGFLVAVVCATVVAAAINTWVDPLRLTAQPWADPEFDPYREISSQIRSGKAGMLRQAGPIDVAFIGSSRIANGFDPSLEQWGDRKVLNLGCSGGFLFESVAIAQYLLRHDPPELILMGIDPGDLTSSVDTRPLGDFYSSPFNPDGDALDREIRYWIGISTLEESLETLERKRLERPATYTPEGLRKRGLGRGRGGHRQLDFIRSNLAGEAFLADDSPTAKVVNPPKIEALRELLSAVRESPTRLVLFLQPRHALLGSSSDGIEEPICLYQAEREALVALVGEANAIESVGPEIDYWEFLDFHPINTEPLPLDEGEPMKYWTDLDHFTLQIGNAMQARMMGWPVQPPIAADYGARVTEESLPARIEQIKHDSVEYLTGSGARDLEWKENMASETP